MLAIRGDMPGGPTVPWQRHPDGLANGTELVRLIADNFDFGIGVAAWAAFLVFMLGRGRQVRRAGVTGDLSEELVGAHVATAG